MTLSLTAPTITAVFPAWVASYYAGTHPCSTLVGQQLEQKNTDCTGKKRYAVSDKTKVAISDFCKHKKIKEAQIYFNLSKSTILKNKNFELKDEQK